MLKKLSPWARWRKKMTIDIEKAKAEDVVGQEFDANYIAGTTDEDMVKARAVMSRLLKKYGGRIELEKDAADWAEYQKAMYVVASRSKDAMIAATKAREDHIKRKNLLSQFFEENPKVLFGLSEWQRINIRKYTDFGLLVGQEFLWDLLKEEGEEGTIAHLANVANYIYNDTGFMGGVREDYSALVRGPVRSIYYRPSCKTHETVKPDCGCGCED